MEVILLEKMSGLGEIGSIISVKDGFARNYLIPRKKVLRATSANKAVVEQKKALLEQQHLERKVAAEKDSASLHGIVVTVIRQAGEDGRLYGSVSARDIAKAVAAAKQISISDEMVVMSVKIKEIGLHTISLELHSDVSVELSVNVARNEQEAAVALAKHAAAVVAAAPITEAQPTQAE